MGDVAAENTRRAWILTAAFVLVTGVVIFVVLALVGLRTSAVLIAAVVAFGLALLSYQTSDAVALRLSGATPADPVTRARLHNLVEGLCIGSGLSKPAIHVIDDPAPNAFAVGRNPKHAAVAVTTGMLELMDRVELEAVLAHELSHVKNDDILVATLAVTMLGFVAPFLVPFAVGERRESSADTSAIEMTRFPPALISALEKLRNDTSVVRVNPRAVAHLWIETPVGPTGDERPTAERRRCTDLPLDARIAVLREL